MKFKKRLLYNSCFFPFCINLWITSDDKTEEKALLKLNNFYNFLVAGWRNRGKFEEHLLKNDFKKSKNGWKRVTNDERPALRIFFNEND